MFAVQTIMQSPLGTTEGCCQSCQTLEGGYPSGSLPTQWGMSVWQWLSEARPLIASHRYAIWDPVTSLGTLSLHSIVR